MNHSKTYKATASNINTDIPRNSIVTICSEKNFQILKICQH